MKPFLLAALLLGAFAAQAQQTPDSNDVYEAVNVVVDRLKASRLDSAAKYRSAFRRGIADTLYDASRELRGILETISRALESKTLPQRWDSPADRTLLERLEGELPQLIQQAQTALPFRLYPARVRYPLLPANSDIWQPGMKDFAVAVDLYRISRPVFLRYATQCLVGWSYDCDPACGEGEMLLLEKRQGTWCLVKMLQSWVS